jgi:hypothetical protein
VIGLLAFAGLGCSPNVKECARGTVFVAVTLEGATQAADTLTIDVTVDSSPPVRTTLTHRPGAAVGGVQIEFPSGYPKGSSVTVSVTASAQGSALGESRVTLALDGACARALLSIAAAGSLDLGAADLATLDSGAADLATVDLLTPDLVCIPTGFEDCFNGADDDCDGLVDCADPDCAPTAECVFDPGSAAAGTLLTGSVSCPTAYAQKTPVGANFTAGSCAMGSCASSGTILGECAVTFVDASADSSCGCAGNSCPTKVYSSVDSCVAWSIAGSHYHEFTTQVWSIGARSSCPVSGAPMKTAGSFSTNDTFCETAQKGGGCAAGQACVPKAGNHCTMLAGSQVACPAHYTNSAPRYFKSIDETLSCACSFIATPGDCTSTASLVDPTCTTFSGGPNTGCYIADWSSYYIKVARSGGTCSPSPQPSGISQAQDEQTICCQ